MSAQHYSLDLDKTTAALVQHGNRHGIPPTDVRASMGQLVNMAKMGQRAAAGASGFEAAIQEGCAAMIRAMCRFDPARGVPFSAYVRGDLRGGVADGLVQESLEAAQVEGCEKIMASLEAPQDDLATELDGPAITRAVDEFVGTLPDRLGQVAHQVLRLGRSRAETARAMGVTRMAITKTMKRIAVRAQETLLPQLAA